MCFVCAIRKHPPAIIKGFEKLLTLVKQCDLLVPGFTITINRQ